MKIIKIAMILGAVFFGYNAFASNPVISDVTVRQRWPWSKLVDIDYVLTCDATQSVDIVVSGFNDTIELTIPPSSLSGDCYDVSYGLRRIVWDPTSTGYTNAGVISKFNVVLTTKQVPLYMIVDLTKTAGAAGQIQYVYEYDLRAGTWGAWVENPVTNLGTVVQSAVWTGVTNDASYATDKLVLRRVPAGAYTMGGNGYTGYPTTLTKPYYAGVFEVTEAQWAKVMGGTGTSKAKAYVTYDSVRGTPTDTPSINWPVTDRSLVKSTSFLGKLRLKTGLNDFDLPTSAQWEYLCRAGTTSVYNDGLSTSTGAQLNLLGWYSGNSSNKVQLVGQKVANAWGLYDTHGNVWEWCLDWREATTTTPVGGIDPIGANSGVARILRGASFGDAASFCYSAYRDYGGGPAVSSWSYGCRLVITLP